MTKILRLVGKHIPPPRGCEGVAANAAGGVGGRAKREGMSKAKPCNRTRTYVNEFTYRKTSP